MIALLLSVGLSLAATPADSLAARPAWDPSDQYAPQAPAEARLHSAPAAGTVTGLVTCAVEADASDPQGLFGRFAAPDLTATLTLGTARMRTLGPEDTRQMRISAPLVTLSPGDRVQISVDDRDLFKVRPVETVTGTYDGQFPLVLAGERVSAACALVAPAQLAGLVDPRVVALRQALATQEPAPWPDLQAEDLGAPSPSLRSGLGDVAGLVGWQDPRVVRLVARHDRLVAVYERALTAVLLETAADPAAAERRVGTVTLRAAALSCDPPVDAVVHPACAVRLPVRLAQPLTLGWPVDLGPIERAQVVSLDGVSELEWRGIVAPDGTLSEHSDLFLPPGDHTLSLVSTWATTPRGPVLLRVQDRHGTWLYLRLD